MIEQIISIRVRLFRYELTLQDRTDSRQLSLAFNNLQEGLMFLGKSLGALGNDQPYKESSNPDSPVIEKLADTHPDPIEIPRGRIPGVKDLRRLIKEVVEIVDTDIIRGPSTLSTDTAFYIIQSKRSLELSVMWLGMELDRIKKMQDRKEAEDLQIKNWLLSNAVDAYKRYGSVTDFKNFQGNPMPQFNELPETIQNAWAEAIRPLFENTLHKGMSNSSQPDPWA